MKEDEWSEVITPSNNLLNFNLKEIYRYRDLIWVFVRRDIVSMYKQTVLGPLWFFLSPFMTVFIYTFVFGRIAGISTEGIPGPVFYLAGTTMWNYFQQCFLASSGTFVINAGIFGKVYFPRMVAPISNVISNLTKFGIQLLVLAAVVLFYVLFRGFEMHMTKYLVLFPALVIMMAGISLGFGIIISSLTTKYRDLQLFVSYGISLMMYACPVIYPLSAVPSYLKTFVYINPITPIIETFRLGLLGQGTFSAAWLCYSFVTMIVLLFAGILLFNKVEKTFMDTV